MLFIGMGLAWVAYATAYYGIMMLHGAAGPGVTGGLTVKQVLSPVGYYTGSASPFTAGGAAAAATSTAPAGGAVAQNKADAAAGAAGAGSTTSTQHVGPGVANNK